MSFNIIALEMWRKLCYNVSSAVLGTVPGDIAAIDAVICESARDSVRCLSEKRRKEWVLFKG